MKNKGKIILCLAAIALAGGTIAGCGSKSSDSGAQSSLRVEIFDRGDVPSGAGSVSQNSMTEWVQKEFGDKNNIKVEYVSVPRNEETSQLNILLAASQAPDIVFTYNYNMLYDYYNKGGLADLTEEVKNADKLKKFLGDSVVERGKIDDKQILIPSKRLIRGRMSQLVRKDWLDAVGLDVPKTTDEFYNMLKAFKEKDPGKLGDKNIPYGMAMTTQLFEDCIDTFEDPDISEKDRTCVPEVMRNGYKEGVRFFNKLYNEGLISPDFALDKDRSQLESDVANGYVGFVDNDLGKLIQSGGAYETLQKNDPKAKFVAADTWTYKNGKHYKQMYAETGLYIAVPKNSEANAKNALKYLNWMADDKVLTTLQYGIEGKNYNMNSEGIPEIINSEEAKKTHWYTLGFDLALIVNGKYSSDMDKVVEMAASATIDKDLYKSAYEKSINDGYSLKTVPPDTSDTSVNTSSLTEKYNEILVKSIMAPESKFDSTFDSLVNEYKSIGGEKAQEQAYKMYEKVYKN
jgi:putative aldouronate transport system substrate-binding protein